MAKKIFTAIDIGTGTIKVLVVRKKTKEDKFEVLGLVEEISSGIRKGVVIEPAEVSVLIRSAFKKIEEQIRQKINSAYVNVGGSHIFSTFSRGLVSVSRADQKISQEDIKRVLEAAQTFPFPSNREILEVFPKEFIIDGEKGIKEPLGMEGVRLEAEVLVLGGFGPYIKSLTTSVLNSGPQINDLFLGPLASSRAVLTPREKELGVALLDIGAGTTGLAVFEEGNLIHLAILPIGSGHITNDIAIGLKTDIDTAEKIKREFGTVFFQGTNKKEKIEMEEEETLVFTHKQLNKIITARLSEIFGEVSKELKKISRQQLLPAGIVLTGGGAKIPKIREFAKKELRLSCRLGKPRGFSPFQEDPRFSVACGLILRGADLEEEEKGFSFPGKGIKSKIKKFFKIFIP
jgi:cell division protein FtsA